MKNAKSLGNSLIPYRAELDVVTIAKGVREVVHEAVIATNDAVRKCLAAGQALNEARSTFSRARGHHGRLASYDDGDGFMEWVAKNIPEIHHDTANRWMKAAARVLNAIGDGSLAARGEYIDIEGIPVSEILARPADELPEACRTWRQSWFDFTADKTIKDCLSEVCVGGEETTNLGRAIAGKTRPGAGDGGDRKDYPAFVRRKLKEMAEHLVVRRTSTQPGKHRDLAHDQRVQIGAAFDAWLGMCPRWLLDTIKAGATRELKLSDVERTAPLQQEMVRVLGIRK
jgi:hypothetical protein